MYDYWNREFVNERLRLGFRQSYRLVPATPSGRIRSDNILLLLNRSRVGIHSAISELPSDLLTPEETAARFAQSGITLRDLRRWTRRAKNVAPHFRLNRNTIRFSEAMLDRWLSENSRPKGACA